MNYEVALNWLYGQLRRKRIAYGNAERKPNRDERELANLAKSIEIIEWIIGVLLEGGNHAEN